MLKQRLLFFKRSPWKKEGYKSIYYKFFRTKTDSFSKKHYKNSNFATF